MPEVIELTELKSDYSPDELVRRWDEFTSPERFAGNDEIELVFVGKRKGRSVKLIRRSKVRFEPYATVFRGKIYDNGSSGSVKGVFTKTVFSYIITALIIAAVFIMRLKAAERGSDLSAVNTILAVSVIAGILLLLNYRRTKRRYVDFICRITGRETDKFIPLKDRFAKRGGEGGESNG